MGILTKLKRKQKLNYTQFSEHLKLNSLKGFSNNKAFQ